MTTRSSYADAFVAAVARSRRLGLPIHDSLLTSETLVPQPAQPWLQSIAQRLLGAPPRSELAAACVTACAFLVRPETAEPAFQAAHLTIGSLSANEQAWFTVTERDCEVWVQQKQIPPGAPFHAWVTLRSLEIVDMTLMASVSEKRSLPADTDWFVAGHPEMLATQRGLRYEPMLVSPALRSLARFGRSV